MHSSSSSMTDKTATNRTMNRTNEQGTADASHLAGGDQTAAVAVLAILLVITVVGCGAAWVVLCALATRRRTGRWRSNKGILQHTTPHRAG